jgi:hypothetical protein
LDILEGQETGKINHLAELGKVVNTSLNFLQTVAHSVTLESDLEKRVAHRALEEEIIGHGADLGAKSNRKDGQNIIVTAGTQKTTQRTSRWVADGGRSKGRETGKKSKKSRKLFFFAASANP